MLHRVSATATELALLAPKVVHETLKHNILVALFCSGINGGIEHFLEVAGHRLGGLEHSVGGARGFDEGIEGRLGGLDQCVMLSRELT